MTTKRTPTEPLDLAEVKSKFQVTFLQCSSLPTLIDNDRQKIVRLKEEITAKEAELNRETAKPKSDTSLTTELAKEIAHLRICRENTEEYLQLYEREYDAAKRENDEARKILTENNQDIPSLMPKTPRKKKGISAEMNKLMDKSDLNRGGGNHGESSSSSRRPHDHTRHHGSSHRQRQGLTVGGSQTIISGASQTQSAEASKESTTKEVTTSSASTYTQRKQAREKREQQKKTGQEQARRREIQQKEAEQKEAQRRQAVEEQAHEEMRAYQRKYWTDNLSKYSEHRRM